MDRMGHKFFSRTCFPAKQHGRTGPAHHVDRDINILHAFAFADDVAGMEFPGQLPLELEVLGAKGGLFPFADLVS
ncbi:MAG: hypothetical protein BWY49_00805 [Candidatus Omnitrophica bacterium ADurb.Bin314]|nr:MAG: hypothetical protein BWY49_00805 [Candidatus Omnitrophica bacterium ADurb.Bin314]